MTGQVRSELLKLRTTRTVATLLLASAALTLLGACVEAFSRTLVELAQEDAQRGAFTSGTAGVFFATFAGLIAVTSEFRYGTIHPTLLVEPRRRVVLAAKLAVAALAGLVLAGMCSMLSLGAGLAILAVRDVDVGLSGAELLAVVLGTTGAGMFSALLGVAVGALIRNQAGAIVAVAAYAFMVDAVLFAAVPSAGRFLPGKSGDALAGLPDADLLSPGMGAATMAAWAVAFVVAAIVRTDRSDVD